MTSPPMFGGNLQSSISDLFKDVFLSSVRLRERLYGIGGDSDVNCVTQQLAHGNPELVWVIAKLWSHDLGTHRK